MGLFDKNQDLNEYNEKAAEQEVQAAQGDLIGSLTSLWGQAADTLNNPNKWGLDTISNDKIDTVFSNSYGSLGSLLNMFGVPEKFTSSNPIRTMIDSPFVQDEKFKQGVTGLCNYKAPTEEQFEKCNEINGLSVWNTKGWWRCLFPKAVIMNNLRQNSVSLNNGKTFVSREDVETDEFHSKYGIFFTEITDYLSWKSKMNKLVNEKAQEELKKRKALKSKISQSDYTTPESLMLDDSNNYETDSKKHIVGKSSYVTFNSSPEGKEQVKQWKTYYDDGTVLVKSEKTLTPIDGSKPISETTEKIMSASEDKNW